MAVGSPEGTPRTARNPRMLKRVTVMCRAVSGSAATGGESPEGTLMPMTALLIAVAVGIALAGEFPEGILRPLTAVPRSSSALQEWVSCRYTTTLYEWVPSWYTATLHEWVPSRYTATLTRLFSSSHGGGAEAAGVKGVHVV